jgi:proteasome lid subunit RPN8/RPN11
MVLLEQREFERIKLQSESAYPEECCAILLGRKENEVVWVVRAVPAINVHNEPEHAYEISAQALISAQRHARGEGLEIVGFVHSHPDAAAEPSPEDLKQALWIGCAYGIAAVHAGKFRELQFFRLQGESVETRRFNREGARVIPTRSK